MKSMLMAPVQKVDDFLIFFLSNQTHQLFKKKPEVSTNLNLNVLNAPETSRLFSEHIGRVHIIP